jgi:hypothetical protein
VQVADEASPGSAGPSRLGPARPSARRRSTLSGLTVVLGLVRLDYRAVHFDESISIARVDESWSRLWTEITQEDPNMSLF